MAYCIQVKCDLPVTSNFISEEVLLKKGYMYFEVTKEELISKKRDQIFVVPRQIIMSILYSNTGYSLKAIGDMFDRNHATVIHSKKVVRDKLFSNSWYRHRYNEFFSLLIDAS